MGSETGNQMLVDLSPSKLGKGVGQSSPITAASCLVMTKLSNEGSEDTVNPTKLSVSTGMLMQQFADESVWRKFLFLIFCSCLTPAMSSLKIP